MERLLKDHRPMTKLVFIQLLLCLAFSVTNLLPVSAALILFIPLLPLLWFDYRPLHAVLVSLGAMLIYFAISAAVYDYHSLFSYDFYRRDGNVFVTFAPLLILSLQRIRVDMVRVLRYFVYWATGMNALCLIIYYRTGHTIFIREEGIYHFLFVAHNAAGGYLSVILAFTIGLYLGTRERRFIALALINIAGLFATDSRGSTIGIAAACVIVLLLRGKFTKTVVIVMIAAQTLLFAWLYTHSSPSDYMQGESAVTDGYRFDAIERGHTVVVRAFYLWPRAISLFLNSPIVGTGFGSYDDLPFSLQGVPHLLMFNQPETMIHSDRHAHHSFLHVLAETGMIGLLMLIYLLHSIWKTIIRLPDSAVRSALRLAFWVCIVSSFTEHRLFTPSQMLPFILILGLAIASSRFEDHTRNYGRDGVEHEKSLH